MTVYFFVFPLFPFFFLHAEYLTHVDLEEEKEKQVIKAREMFDKGEGECTTVPILLEKLSCPGLMPFYYCGGFEILSQAITDCESFLRDILHNYLPSLPPPPFSTPCFAGSHGFFFMA